ncbi:UDP-3-O-acylglucosamine N-acyltransferase [Caulifigura coniformis]|uniref:UDP-3-O-acylglucosamine N-acyltransferase n=1 Tax=Caulifigura coniformis TaxID=2527983 RepID=A0A517SLD2_9PLAN|nr:UDP-3-O-(3-hydroxymyristoyl)glucosamine N-acyltransferase [Caulifigura coniformis]QDT56934.1 UDP-3-O-acylglucosamine N-acyltransferase [Caulifigura coniformis]
MAFTVEQLAQQLGCAVLGDPTRRLVDVRPLSEAGDEHVTFVGDRKQLGKASQSSAGAIVVPRKLGDSLDASRTWLVADDAQAVFIRAMLLFRPLKPRATTGISPGAHVSSTAQIGRDVNILPGAYVGEHAVLGDRCDIGPGAVVGDGCRLEEEVIVHANAVLYHDISIGARSIIHSGAVIGADGFGYRFADGRYERIPHTGTVVIESDVEIGACTTIDRAMVGETRIGEGTKLDNLIMIGHNCRLGKHNAFASQVGLAGSVTSGDYVRCAGQVGIADHLHLGTGSTLGAKAGVMNDIPDGSHQIGVPCQPEKDTFRMLLNVSKLPDILQQLKTLTKQVAELQRQQASGEHAEQPSAA